MLDERTYGWNARKPSIEADTALLMLCVPPCVLYFHVCLVEPVRLLSYLNLQQKITMNTALRRDGDAPPATYGHGDARLTQEPGATADR